MAGTTFQAFDSGFQTLTANGGKTTLKRCTCASDINLTNTAFESLRLTFLGNLIASAPIGSGQTFVMVQSGDDARNSLFQITGYNVWLAFSQLGAVSLVNSSAIFVGNSNVNLSQSIHYTIWCQGGSLTCYNNLLRGYPNYCAGDVNVILLSGTTNVTLINNTLQIDNADCGRATTVASSGSLGPITIKSCILICRRASYPAAIVADTLGQNGQVSYCFFDGGAAQGITAINSLSGSGELAALDSNYDLAANSPCLHAGPSDVVYDNTDGTRNNIGWTGGPFYNPANLSINNPIVFWLGTTNQTVLKGLQTSIPISIGASAGH